MALLEAPYTAGCADGSNAHRQQPCSIDALFLIYKERQRVCSIANRQKTSRVSNSQDLSAVYSRRNLCDHKFCNQHLNFGFKLPI